MIAFGDEGGQSTVEFAVVTFAFLAVSLALGVLWRMLGDGLPVEHALAAASHHVWNVPAPNIADVFRY